MKNYIFILVIGLLAASLIYEVIQNHRVSRHNDLIRLAVNIQLLQRLDRGDVAEVKTRLASFIWLESHDYENRYGHEDGTMNSFILTNADSIAAVYAAAVDNQ